LFLNLSPEPSPPSPLMSFFHAYETTKASNKTRCNEPENPRRKMGLRRKLAPEYIKEDEFERLEKRPSFVESKRCMFYSLTERHHFLIHVMKKFNVSIAVLILSLRKINEVLKFSYYSVLSLIYIYIKHVWLII
jgi:hypothetical protein